VISFEAGSAELSSESVKKLDDIVKGLKERTELRLEIKGIAYENPDWPIVGEAQLERELKAAKVRESGGDEDDLDKLAQVQLSKEEYQHLLLNQFRTRFPNEPLGRYAEQLIEDAPLAQSTVNKLKKKLLAADDKGELRDLARARAQAIFEYITEKGGIPNARVFLLDPKVEPSAGEEGVTAELNLTA
jgi:hypothetical protein